MSSIQKNATFVYTNRAITIPCQGKEKLVELIKKYIDQLNPNSSINDYYFIMKEIKQNEVIMKRQLKKMSLVKMNLLYYQLKKI